MALPEPFSDVEHLQAVVRRYLNKQIRENFRDLFGDGDTWEPEVGTTRGSMLRALLHEDSDPIQVTCLRMMLYYFTYGKARDLQTPIYGIPTTTFHESLRFHPQIRLYFLEDSSQVESDFSPVEGEFTFRLMDEDAKTITPTDAQRYANKIKQLFASNSGFVWKKGKQKWLYKDTLKGYDFRLLAWNEAEAKKVIEQVLDIQGHTPDWNILEDATKVKDEKVTSPIPDKHLVYGKQRRKPRHRPVAYVRFRYAELKLWGLQNDITLVDRTGSRRRALIKA